MTDNKRRYRHIVIRCHPEPESFNAAMAKAYCAEVGSHGHEAIVRDLYGMAFDPVLKARDQPGMAFQPMPDVEKELSIIAGGDVFVLIYPIWFGGPPAMLKGYVERVLGSGAMPLQLKQEAATGVLAKKRLVSFTSSGTDEHWLATQGQLESLISGFDRYIEHGFAMHPAEHYHFGSITAGAEPAEIERCLHEVKARAGLLCMNLDRASAESA
jgi:NAD(P)H dehydrogenase (quinone)